MSINALDGIITCIPKEGKLRNDLKNWRPLTLLNSLYNFFFGNDCQQAQKDIILNYKWGPDWIYLWQFHWWKYENGVWCHWLMWNLPKKGTTYDTWFFLRHSTRLNGLLLTKHYIFSPMDQILEPWSTYAKEIQHQELNRMATYLGK